MKYIESNFDNYTPEGILYKRSLVHIFLKNKPIVIEAKSIHELNEKVKETKEILDKEWAKVELQNKYQKLTHERLGLLKNSLKETQLLKWKRFNIPLKIFSTDIIKYDDLCCPVGYYNCGENSQKFRVVNNDTYFSTIEPSKPKEQYFHRLWYMLFKDEKKLDSLDRRYSHKKEVYSKDLNRYKLFAQEQRKWKEKYMQTIESRRRDYYIQNPSLIGKEAYNLLEKSRFHSKPLGYSSEYFNYNTHEKKLSVEYYLPAKQNIQKFLREPNYESLQWNDVSEKEEQERIDSIFSQLILIALSEQFVADKLKLIDFIFIKTYSLEWNRGKGKYDWQEFKELELSRKGFEEDLNLKKLDPSVCIRMYEKKYKDKINNREKIKSNDKLDNRLSLLESTLESAIEDIPYNIDIEPSINTNIETLNNNGIVNLKK